MKKIVFFGLLLLTLNFSGQNKVLLDSVFKKFINNHFVSSAHIGIQLKDISQNRNIIAYNDKKLFVPASIQKLFTTSSALCILPENFQFKTVVLHSGKLNSENFIEGDLYIKGSGDPSLESKYFKNKSFIRNFSDSILSKHIKGFKGKIKLINNHFNDYSVNSNWLWGDIGNYYGAGVSNLTFRDNTVEVYFNSSNEIGELTTISKTIPSLAQFNIENKVVSGKTKSDLAYAFGGPNNENRFIKGEIPNGKKDFKVKLSMHNPTQFLENEIKSIVEFQNQEIVISSNLDTLLVYKSPLLNRIVSNINHKSNNNYAEHILLKSMYFLDSAKTLENAASSMSNYWSKKLNNTDKFMMVDGCGLSRKNSISPSLMNDLLSYMFNYENKKVKNDFIASLPIAGKTGTLKYLGDGTLLENNFFGKSGSMSGVRCYSGYFKKNNKYYAFTIMLNHMMCTSLQSFKLIEKFMVDVYKQL